MVERMEAVVAVIKIQNIFRVMYLVCQYETDGLALLLKALQVTPGSTYYFTFASGDYEVCISHHIMESTDPPIK